VGEPSEVSTIAARVEACTLFACLASTTVALLGAPCGVSGGGFGRSDGSWALRIPLSLSFLLFDWDLSISLTPRIS